MFWAYILRCSDGRYYTGHSDNLEVRISQHQHGGYCAYTSRRRPVTLAWSQEFPTRLEALEAERRVGGWSRAKKEALIQGDWNTLSHFARPPKERSSTEFILSDAAGGVEGLGTNGKISPVQIEPFVSSVVETPRPKRP